MDLGKSLDRCYHSQKNRGTQKLKLSYIIVAPEFFQKNRSLHLAAFTCWVSQKLLFFLFSPLLRSSSANFHENRMICAQKIKIFKYQIRPLEFPQNIQYFLPLCSKKSYQAAKQAPTGQPLMSLSNSTFPTADGYPRAAKRKTVSSLTNTNYRRCPLRRAGSEAHALPAIQNGPRKMFLIQMVF